MKSKKQGYFKLGDRFGEWGIGPWNLWASQNHNLATKFKDKRESVSVP